MTGAADLILCALRDVLGDSLLALQLDDRAPPFAERLAEAGLGLPGDAALRLGLARLLAASLPDARLAASRRPLLPRIASLTPAHPRRRGAELDAAAGEEDSSDLEAFLDRLRIDRREETFLAACVDLSDRVPFPTTSELLSAIAEWILRRALAAALARGPAPAGPVTVVGMGKIGGREFSYHSDLDLVFLVEGGTDEIHRASRAAQRLVHYLSTMTGAGVAYAVDVRLRPSGHQGMLVTSFDAFRRYQLERADTWEHLALVRARALAGDRQRADRMLHEVRTALAARAQSPWGYAAEMRARVERQRGRERPGEVAVKTGPGGLMDLDFLAAGAFLELGHPPAGLPSVEGLLRAAVGGPAVDELLTAYHRLRVVEARARLLAGRSLEVLELRGAAAPILAALCGHRADPDGLEKEVGAHRRAIRRAFRAVVEAGTVRRLEELGPAGAGPIEPAGDGPPEPDPTA